MSSLSVVGGVYMVFATTTGTFVVGPLRWLVTRLTAAAVGARIRGTTGQDCAGTERKESRFEPSDHGQYAALIEQLSEGCRVVVSGIIQRRLSSDHSRWIKTWRHGLKMDERADEEPSGGQQYDRQGNLSGN